MRRRRFDIQSGMEDFLAQLKALISDRAAFMEWLKFFLVLMAVYMVGYLSGILPPLLHRERRRREQSAILCEELFNKMIEHEELYNRCVHEAAPFQKTLIVEQIALVKEDLIKLELRLATLERREPRKLPLRPLPVRHLKIE